MTCYLTVLYLACSLAHSLPDAPAPSCEDASVAVLARVHGSLFSEDADPPGTGAAWHSPVLTWEERRNYNLRVELSPSSWRVYRDGVLVGSTTHTGPFSWGSTVRIGDRLDGAISSLRIRSN